MPDSERMNPAGWRAAGARNIDAHSGEPAGNRLREDASARVVRANEK
jgi:hypothetical protein